MTQFKSFLPLHLQFFAETKEEGLATELKTLQTSFQESWTNLKGLLDQQSDEIKTNGETAEETAKKIKGVEEKLTEYDKEMKGLSEKLTSFETKANRGAFFSGEPKEIKTAGELFAESDTYKSFVANNGQRTENVMIKSFYTKDLDSTGPNGGLLVQPLRVPEIIGAPNQEMRLRDLLRVQPTTSNAIDYIVETGFTNAAATVPEKTLKPESDITFDQRTASVKVIASWIPATRQIIADATQLRSYIDNRLIYGLKLAEEGQILFGSGLGEDLQGLMTNAEIQNVGGLAAGDTMIDHIRRAMTRSILAGYPVTGIVLHPADWAEIQLLKGGNGHYIWVDVTTGGVSRLWAVPVVQSLGMTEGSFLLGAFGLGATLYDREQANVRVGEPNDYFLRNQLAILAEERLALATFRPESFVRGDFAAAI